MTAPVAEKELAMTSTTATHNADLPGAIRSEWVKFRGLTSNVALTAFAFALILANAILMPVAYVFRDRGSSQADYDAYPGMIIDKTGYIGLVLAIVAALLVTNEYRSGQIKTTLLSLPRRTPALIAKAAVIAGVSFIVGALSAGIGFALAPALLAGGGYSYDFGIADALRLIVGSGLYLATLSMIGIALGVLIRNVVASVLAVIALLVLVPIVPQIFSEYGAEITRFFPIQAGSLLLAQPAADGPLGPWTGYLILLAWSIVLLAFAAVALKRRDA
jgi:ABC-2 type transport system permease protein